MYLFLDDERLPLNVTWMLLPRATPHWIILRSYDEFCEFLDTFTMFAHPDDKIEHISFDHDLADIHYGGDYSDERTGYDCAKYLSNWCIDRGVELPNWTVHSMNPEGKKNIDLFLQNHRRHIDGKI